MEFSMYIYIYKKLSETYITMFLIVFRSHHTSWRPSQVPFNDRHAKNLWCVTDMKRI